MKHTPSFIRNKEVPKYVCIIRYQIPKRILLNGRRKVSPKYDTLYGMMYWLNMQNYNLDYMILKTTTNSILLEGSKKIGEKIV